MSLQMMAAGEALVAGGERTTVRALSVVYAHVLLEVGLCEETLAAPHRRPRIFSTRRAGRRTGARVDPHLAVERVPVMEALVRSQAVERVETLPAARQRAHVWLLLRVHPQVYFQAVARQERLSAAVHRTGKRKLP